MSRYDSHHLRGAEPGFGASEWMVHDWS